MIEPTRIYSTDEVIVEWRPELCSHCHSCANGLPSVFDPAKRPWVDIHGSSADLIKNQVSQCPTGALFLGVIDNAKSNEK